MATKIGDAYVNIVPKAENIKSEMEKLLGDASGSGNAPGKKTGDSFLSGLKSVVTVAAIGKIVKDAFSAGAELQQSFGGLDTIYGDAAAAAKDYAFEAAQAGISANDFAEQAVSFGAALKKAYGGDTTAAMEAANVAILDMADNAAKMGTPIESIQQAYQGFARGQYQLLDNLKLGYGGTKTEMERLLAEAQKISGVEYDISNLGDVYNAIHVIQGELGLTGVAAAEAQTTLSGSFNALSASWTNLMAAMMTGEGLEEAMANLSTSAGYFINNVLAMLGSLAPQIPAFIMGILDALIANAPNLIAGGVEMIIQLIVGFLNAIPSFVAALPELFSSARDAITGLDWASIGIDVINGIINGVWAAASGLFNALRDLASNALASAKSALGIASPSKLFANEVGRWIPAGMAVGIEDNMSPLNSTMSDMASTLTSDMNRATQSGNVIQQPYSQQSQEIKMQNVTKIEFNGSLAQFARILTPHIVVEQERIGPSLIT